MACFCTIASGSSGNCTYIGSGVGGILVDVGVSCKGILTALRSRDIDPESVRGIFITHEHIDHIKGLRVLLKKLEVPVYATEEVLSFLADHDHLPAGARAYGHPHQNFVGVGHRFLKFYLWQDKQVWNLCDL